MDLYVWIHVNDYSCLPGRNEVTQKTKILKATQDFFAAQPYQLRIRSKLNRQCFFIHKHLLLFHLELKKSN